MSIMILLWFKHARLLLMLCIGTFQAACSPISFSPIQNSNSTFATKDRLLSSMLIFDKIEEFESYFDSEISVSSIDEGSEFVYIKSTDEVCSKNKKVNKQYCVTTTSQPETFIDDIGAPLTACLDSRFGEGGSTSKSFSVGVTVGPGFSVVLSDTTVSAISLSGGVSVTQSVSFGLSDSCDVTKGNIVQMWGYPFYTTANIKYRTFKKSRTGKKKWSNWSDEREVTFATSIGPATKCIGSVSEHICGQTPVKRKFIVPGEPLVDDI